MELGTNRDAVWGVDSGWPKEATLGEESGSSQGKGRFWGIPMQAHCEAREILGVSQSFGSLQQRCGLSLSALQQLVSVQLSSVLPRRCESKVKYTDTAVRSLTCHTATGTHMPYRITQCYLPPDRGDIPAFIPAEAGTRLSDPGGMQCQASFPDIISDPR